MGSGTQTQKLTPVSLGNGVAIAVPVILAPMSGVTDLPFRRLAKQLGTGMVVSEMIASWAMLRENRNTLRMAALDPTCWLRTRGHG
jgi:tRNA-dihydrouridine synthase B